MIANITAIAVVGQSDKQVQRIHGPKYCSVRAGCRASPPSTRTNQSLRVGVVKLKTSDSLLHSPSRPCLVCGAVESNAAEGRIETKQRRRFRGDVLAWKVKHHISPFA